MAIASAIQAHGSGRYDRTVRLWTFAQCHEGTFAEAFRHAGLNAVYGLCVYGELFFFHDCLFFRELQRVAASVSGKRQVVLPKLNRFEQVLRKHVVFFGQVGDRSCDAQHSHHAAGRQPLCVTCAAQKLAPVVFQ